MNKKKINKLLLILNKNLLFKNKEKNFFNYFLNLFSRFHFVTKFSIIFFFIIIDFLSIIFFLKKFKNLSFQQSKFIINYLSSFKIFGKVIQLFKVYSLVFFFSK